MSHKALFLGPSYILLYIDKIYQVASNCTIMLFADDIALYKQIISDDQALLQNMFLATQFKS